MISGLARIYMFMKQCGQTRYGRILYVIPAPYTLKGGTRCERYISLREKRMYSNIRIHIFYPSD
jgi:hypothetical protein